MAKSNKNNNQPIDLSVDKAGKTELVWPGKRKEVERVELPFQTIETINLPRGTRQEELFGANLSASGGEDGWKDRLIWGDNLFMNYKTFQHS